MTGASDTGAALGEGRGTGAVWLGAGAYPTAGGVGATRGVSWDGAGSLGDRLGETPDWTWLGDGSLGDTPGEWSGVPAVQAQSSARESSRGSRRLFKESMEKPSFSVLQYRHSRRRGRSKRGEPRDTEKKTRIPPGQRAGAEISRLNG